MLSSTCFFQLLEPHLIDLSFLLSTATAVKTAQTLWNSKRCMWSAISTSTWLPFEFSIVTALFFLFILRSLLSSSGRRCQYAQTCRIIRFTLTRQASRSEGELKNSHRNRFEAVVHRVDRSPVDSIQNRDWTVELHLVAARHAVHPAGEIRCPLWCWHLQINSD